MPIVALDNPARRYDWGSPDAIPTLLGIAPDGSPYAELWLGAHPSAPSGLRGQPHGNLAAWIAAEPEAVLGARERERFGNRLPFLLKVLAAQRALSIQAHPSPEQAAEGFARENAAGIALDDPARNYRDAFHKPEMVCALTEFDALMGVRPHAESRAILGALRPAALGAGRADYWARVERGLDEGGAEAVLALLLEEQGESAAVLEATLAGAAPELPGQESELLAELGRQYPSDPGALVALLLNRVRLAPGEVMAMPSGNVHAYLSGVAVEIMASSDNVLRAGLTSKHIDVAELRAVADFRPHTPTPVPNTGSGGHRVYAPGVPDFSLHVIDVAEGEALPTGPAIALCLDGEFRLAADGEDVRLSRGDSVVLAHDLGVVSASGGGLLVVAAPGT